MAWRRSRRSRRAARWTRRWREPDDHSRRHRRIPRHGELEPVLAGGVGHRVCPTARRNWSAPATRCRSPTGTTSCSTRRRSRRPAWMAGTPSCRRARPSVTVFDEAFKAPRSWRASLGAQRRIFDRYNLNVDASFTRGVAQTGYTDLNLNPNRAVHARRTRGTGRCSCPRPPSCRPAASPTCWPRGAITRSRRCSRSALTSSRRRSSSRCRCRASPRAARSSTSGTRWAMPRTSRQAVRSVDLAAGSGAAAALVAAAGALARRRRPANPNVREWSVSSFDRRHSITGSLTWPVNLGLEVTGDGARVVRRAVHAARRVGHQRRRLEERPRVHLRPVIAVD